MQNHSIKHAKTVRRMGSARFPDLPAVKPGDSVRILSGRYYGLAGTVEEVAPNGMPYIRPDGMGAAIPGACIIYKKRRRS